MFLASIVVGGEGHPIDVALRSGARDRQLWALGRVVRLRAEAAPFVPAVADLLVETGLLGAACALEAVGPPAVPALLELCASPAAHVRSLAAEALTRMGTRAIPALVAALEAKPSRRRVATILDILRENGPLASEAIPAVEPYLETKDAPAAALTLALAGDRSPGVVAALQKSLQETSGWAPPRELSAVARLGRAGRRLVPALRSRMVDQPRYAKALSAVLGADADVVPTLLKLAAAKEEGGSGVYDAIGYARAESRKHVPRLLELAAVVPDGPWSRLHDALNEIGIEGRAADRVLAMIGDDDPVVHSRGASLLPLLVGRADFVASQLRSDRSHVRTYAAIAALRRDNSARPEMLKPLLADEDLDAAVIAFSAYARASRSKADAEALLPFLRWPDVRAAHAAGALGTIAVRSDTIERALIDAFDHELDVVRFSAAAALAQLGAAADRTKRRLRRHLEDEHERMRCGCAAALVRSGALDRRVLEVVEAALRTAAGRASMGTLLLQVPEVPEAVLALIRPLAFDLDLVVRLHARVLLHRRGECSLEEIAVVVWEGCRMDSSVISSDVMTTLAREPVIRRVLEYAYSDIRTDPTLRLVICEILRETS